MAGAEQQANIVERMIVFSVGCYCYHLSCITVLGVCLWHAYFVHRAYTQ